MFGSTINQYGSPSTVQAQGPATDQDYGDGWSWDATNQMYYNSQNGMRMAPNEYNSYMQQENQRKIEAEREAKRVADLKAQGLNPDGSPIRQAWDTLVDPTTGKLKDGYTMNLSGLDPTQWEGFSKYKQEALRTGPSAWAGLQTNNKI